MIISFTGAQSTGKSTLLTRLTLDERFRDYNFIPEVTRLVKKKYNLKINEECNEETQIAILLQHFSNYLENKNNNAILDRCILDGYVYTHYFMLKGIISNDIGPFLHYLFLKLIGKIDIIFYTEPDIPLVDDGERSVDVEFRDKIVKLFEMTIDHYNINVVRLKGTLEERLNTIYNTIDNYGKQ